MFNHGWFECDASSDECPSLQLSKDANIPFTFCMFKMYILS